jgi:hypothetical protein
MTKFKLESDTAEASYRFIAQAHTSDGLLTESSMKKFIEVGLPSEYKNKKANDIFELRPLREALAER